jgi:hypothetical protein
MHRLHGAVAIASVLGVSWLMSGCGSSDSSNKVVHESLHAQLKIVNVVRLHAGKPAGGAPVAGDTVTVTGTISRRQRVIGRTDVTCTFSTPKIELCLGIDHIPGGTIVHEGAEPQDKPGVDAITGGLGRYRGARGTYKVVFTSADGASLDYAIDR